MDTSTQITRSYTHPYFPGHSVIYLPTTVEYGRKGRKRTNTDLPPVLVGTPANAACVLEPGTYVGMVFFPDTWDAYASTTYVYPNGSVTYIMDNVGQSHLYFSDMPSSY